MKCIDDCETEREIDQYIRLKELETFLEDAKVRIDASIMFLDMANDKNWKEWVIKARKLLHVWNTDYDNRNNVNK